MAITTFTGDLSAFFPAGTSLEARPASNWAVEKRPPAPGSTPPGSATDTATSAASGVVSFDGLADSTEYFVSDAAGTRYVRITTFPERQEVMTSTVEYRTAVAVTGEYVNPFDPKYGAVGSGLVDDSAAWALATADWLSADRGELIVPPNKRMLLSPAVDTLPVRLPPNTDIAKRKTVRFYGGSHAVMSANMRGLFLPGRTADNQTWRGYDFIDVAVDRNNIAGSDDVIFGPTRAGGQGTYGTRNNYRDMRFIRPRAWNVPASGGVAPVRIIDLFSRQIYTNEGDLNWDPHSKVQNTILDILVENPQFDGGDYGVVAYAALQRGSTSGMRIKNFSGSPSVINYVGLTGAAPPVDDWIFIGTGQWFERHRIAAVADNGDGTGSLTLGAALAFTQPTDDGTGAGKGAPMVSGNAVNVWHDRIRIAGGYIALGVGAYGCAVQYVGSGIGGHELSIEDIDVSGSADNNIEIDTALGFVARNVHSKDPGNQSFMHRNFNLPQDQANRFPLPGEQVHELVDCTHEIDAIQPTIGAPGCGVYAGYNWTPGHSPAGAAPTFGTLKFRNFKAIDKSPQWRAIKGGALYCGNDCSINRLEGDIEFVKDAASDASATTPRPFYISPSSVTSAKLRLKSRTFGTATGGQVTLVHLEPFTPSGQTSQHDLHVDIDLDVHSTLAGVAAASTRFFDIGELVTNAANKGTIHGRLGARVIAFGGADTNPRPFRWNGGGNLSIVERIFIDGCDFTKLGTGGVIHNFQGSVPVAYQRFISHTRRNILLGTFSNFTGSGQFLGSGSGFQEYDVTVGASPFTFINETTVDLRVRVTGGTVSAVDFSYNSGTTYQTGKLPTAFDSFVLRPGEAIKITHTGAPSMFVWPLL